MLLALASLLLIGPAALAQQEQEKPAENLQVLPKDISHDDLIAIMQRWSHALGVRCVHCHDDPLGHGFESIDWVSDAKPAKWTAREMVKLTRSANEAIAAIGTITWQAVSVTCETCHRGVARPIPLENLLHEVFSESGAEAATERYQFLSEQYGDGFAYDFREGSLNNLALRLIREGHASDALTFLQLNAERYPNSARVQEVLSDAYLASGDLTSAIAAMEKALQLDPRLRGGRDKLNALRER